MDFQDIGAHCSFCNKRDYLPFTCNGCSKIFCLKHKTTSSHNCSSPPALSTKLNNNNNNNVKSQGYRLGGEKRAVKSNCSHPKCKVRELLPCTCPRCHKQYCLTHRWFDSHGCQPSLLSAN